MNDISNNETHKSIYKRQKDIKIEIPKIVSIPPRICAPRSSNIQPKYTYYITKYSFDN